MLWRRPNRDIADIWRPVPNPRWRRAVVVVGGLVLLMVLGVFIGVQTGVLALTTESKISRQLSLGQKYLLEEDYAQAVIAFNKVIELDASRIEAYEGLMDTYIVSADYSSAISTWQDGEQYMETLGADEQSSYNGYLTTISAAISNIDVTSDENAAQVIAWCSELLQCAPNLVSAYAGIIDAYLYQGDVDAAYDSYMDAMNIEGMSRTEIANTLASQRDQLRRALEDLLGQTDDMDEQIRILQMLLQLYTSNTNYKNRLNTLLEEQEQRQALEQFISENQDALHELLATCESGDDDAIVALYYSDAFAAVYASFPDSLSTFAMEENGTTLVLLRPFGDYDDGLYIYYGEIHDNVISGEGNLYVALDANNSVVGRDVDLHVSSDNGGYAIYKGHWENNMPNGAGTYVEYGHYSDGSIYTTTVTGNYTNGLEDGSMTRVAWTEYDMTFHYTADMGQLRSIGSARPIFTQQDIDIAARSEETKQGYCGYMETADILQGVIPYGNAVTQLWMIPFY